jgi:hypothetical protein
MQIALNAQPTPDTALLDLKALAIAGLAPLIRTVLPHPTVQAHETISELLVDHHDGGDAFTVAHDEPALVPQAGTAGLDLVSVDHQREAALGEEVAVHVTEDVANLGLLTA